MEPGANLGWFISVMEGISKGDVMVASRVGCGLNQEVQPRRQMVIEVDRRGTLEERRVRAQLIRVPTRSQAAQSYHR